MVVETRTLCREALLGCDQEIFREWAEAKPEVAQLLENFEKDWKSERRVHAGTRASPTNYLTVYFTVPRCHVHNNHDPNSCVAGLSHLHALGEPDPIA